MKIYYHPIYKDYGADKNGNVYSKKFGKLKKLRPLKLGGGYLANCFTISPLEYKWVTVNRFVYEAINKCVVQQGYDVDHIDGDKYNNHFSNLQVLSHRDNVAKAKKRELDTNIFECKKTGTFRVSLQLHGKVYYFGSAHMYGIAKARAKLAQGLIGLPYEILAPLLESKDRLAPLGQLQNIISTITEGKRNAA